VALTTSSASVELKVALLWADGGSLEPELPEST